MIVVDSRHTGAVDCIIAQTCLDVGAALLSPDRDFERIARHTPLRPCGR